MGIANYIGKSLDYDDIWIDTDNPQTMASFMIQNSRKNFFSTSYDEFELQRSLEILSVIRGNIQFIKLIISSDINNKHDNYLDHLFEKFSINWNEEKVIFPDTDFDRSTTLSNQLTKQISISKYSSTYKDSLEYLISLILEGVVEQATIRRMIRKK